MKTPNPNLPIKPSQEYAPFRAANRAPFTGLECPFNHPQGPRDEHGAQTRPPENGRDAYDVTLGIRPIEAVLHGGESKF